MMKNAMRTNRGYLKSKMLARIKNLYAIKPQRMPQKKIKLINLYHISQKIKLRLILRNLASPAIP